MAARTFADIWIRPEVFPIWAAVGGAVGLSAFFITRQVSCSPGFRIYKDGRGEECVPETKARVKEGDKWRNHAVRRFVSGCDKQIFQGLNDAMSK